MGFIPTRRQFLVLLLGYFGLHVLLRGLVSETAGIDDVDQILRAQIWSWGYGPQPPLYTWLMKVFLGVFGFNIFAVTLLKESLLFASYLLAYANARWLTRSHLCGLAAAAALQLMPSVFWESHRELTNTILASALVLAVIYLFLRLKSDDWRTYALLGVAAGLGILSKYNFLIVYVALMLAALSLKEFRPLALNRKMLLAVLITAAICAPHLLWVWRHPDLAFSSVYKLRILETQSWWISVWAGLKKWSLVIIAHLGPLVLIFYLIFWKSARRVAIKSAEQKLLCNTLVWMLSLVTVSILLFRVTGFRDRYVQPLFIWLPILLVSLVHKELTADRLRVLLGLATAVAGVVLILAPGRLLLTESLKKNELLNTPFRAFARDLRPTLESTSSIVAENHALGGNLRLWYPHKLVVDAEVQALFPRINENCVLVWDATINPTPPKKLLGLAAALAGNEATAQIWSFQEPLKYHRYRTMRVGVAVLKSDSPAQLQPEVARD